MYVTDCTADMKNHHESRRQQPIHQTPYQKHCTDLWQIAAVDWCDMWRLCLLYTPFSAKCLLGWLTRLACCHGILDWNSSDLLKKLWADFSGISENTYVCSRSRINPYCSKPGMYNAVSKEKYIYNIRKSISVILFWIVDNQYWKSKDYIYN